VKRSETISALAAALVLAQGKIKGAVRDATNPFFQSKYSDLESVIAAVKVPLLENGITFLQGLQDAEGGVAVETMLLHTSGEWISSVYSLPATKNDPQAYGSAASYAKRYGLKALLGVPDSDDDGNAATAAVAPPVAVPKRGRPVGPRKPAAPSTAAPDPETGEILPERPADYWGSIAEATSLDELQAIWSVIPVRERPEYLAIKNARKSALSNPASEEGVI